MHRDRGMTLIELLVVMSILTILVGTIAVVALQASTVGPRKAASADMHRIGMALDNFKLDFRKYPPDTGFGLDIDNPPSDCEFDPGSLWRNLVEPVFDSRRGKMMGPYLEWEQDRLKRYPDARFTGDSYYLTDPWGNPYGYIGDPKRVIHNQGTFDIWSMGADGVTAYNNDEDDYVDGEAPDGYKDVPNTNPKSQNTLSNRAYNGEDDDRNGFVDDANEFGPEAILNGDVGDDINNWTAN